MSKEEFIKTLKKLAKPLIDDGLNKEYTRGICELIADIDGIPDVAHWVRAKQIKREILNQNKEDGK